MTKYDHIIEFVTAQIADSRKREKDPRRDQVIKNWRYFHGNVDWSHKKREDSKIHMHKVGIAAERHRAKFKQNLMKFEKWMSVELLPGFEEKTITTHFAKNITSRHLERAKGKTKLSDAILFGEMEGRAALKVSWSPKIHPKYIADGNQLRKSPHMKGQLSVDTRDFTQLHVDQHNPECPMFVAEELYVDKYELLKMAAEEPTANKPFKLDKVKELTSFRKSEVFEVKDAQSGQEEGSDTNKFRPQVQIINYYGTILDEDGNILELDGKKLENIFVTIANESCIIREPQSIPRWSGQAPLVFADLLRVPGKGLKAIMDAGVALNQAENELVNVMIDGALRASQNITWYRKNWIADKKKISGGLKYGDSVAISDNMPINGEPIGTVKTGDVPQEALMIHQLVSKAFAENVFSNQLDLSGNMPSKQVRATEVAQASQAIGDIFDALAMDVEEDLIEPFLFECFLEIMQHSDEIPEDEIRAAFGPKNKAQADAFIELTPQERFAEAANGFRFVAKGLRGQIANSARAQAVINFVSTISANPIIFQAIEPYVSIPKLVLDIAKGLGLDGEEISTDPLEQWFIQQKQLIREQALAQEQVQPEQGSANASQQGPKPDNQPGPVEGF